MTGIVNGIGLASALGGYEAATTAYRANARGFKRERSVIGVDGMGVTMAAAIPMPEMRDILDRLVTLISDAVADLPVPMSSNIPITLCLPPWLRETDLTEPLAQRLAQGALRQTSELRLAWEDDTPFASVLTAALAQEEERLVAVLDTYLLPELLDLLAATGRIQSSRQPHGFIPGEAALVFRVTPQGADMAPAGVGHIAGARIAHDETDLTRPEGLLGEIIADLWAEAIDARTDRLLLDLNGERWRAEEAAHCLARHADRLDAALTGDPETPALNFGYTGIAAAPLMIALALTDGPKPPERTEEWSLISASLYGGTRMVIRTVRGVAQPSQPVTARGNPP
ncbi:hypothetical protein V8J82_00020 [Gymnodinialimonas sp. 2305UL16-5]|uniref:hypothetical protein n=1 Tax=Gymnodinialimonas mytili TaxID=3126503 RepID=UPI0030A27710